MNKKARITYRITLDFPPDSRAQLDDLMIRTNCTTKAQLFKRALSLLDWIVEHATGDGKKLIVVDKDGNQQQVVFPILKIT